MATPFIAEISMFGGNFAPRSWAFCNGQILAISQNPALFSLLGTTYGGNGTSNFGLPNLQGCVPMHPGQGAGLTSRVLGETGGSASINLSVAQMPGHAHTTAVASGTTANSPSPAGHNPATPAGGTPYADTGSASMYPPTAASGAAGGSLPHNNLMPYLAVSFIIALTGVFPARN